MRDTVVPWVERAEGVEGIYYNLTMPLQEAMTKMESTGMIVDRARLLELSGQYQKRISEAQTAFWETAGEEVRYTSYPELKRYLYEVLKLPVIRKTKSGEPSTDLLTLDKFKGVHPSIDHLIELKRVSKLKKDFLDGLGDGKSKGLLPFIMPDGRIHTTFRVDGTETGRLSSRTPNLHNIAKVDDIRAMFQPAPGHVLVECDYSQLELRIIAKLSSDKRMQAAVDTDMHAHTAAFVIYKIALDQVTKSQRDKAKPVNFGVAYGMGEATLSFRLNCSIEEARDILEKWFSYYKDVDRWMRNIRYEVKRNGFVDNIFGRRRHLPQLLTPPKWDPNWRQKEKHMLRQAVNFPIQSTGSDFLSMATISLVLYPDEAFSATGAKPVLTLHDALYFEVPEDTYLEAAAHIESVMEQIPKEVFGDDWNFPADLKIGRYWGDSSLTPPKTNK